QVLRARATADSAVGPHEVERLHLADERFQIQTASVSVTRQGARYAEAIRACLFLNDPPLPGPSLLNPIEIADQLRPFDAALNRDHAALIVEGQHPVHASHIQEDAGFAELLAPHRVSAPCDRD